MPGLGKNRNHGIGSVWPYNEQSNDNDDENKCLNNIDNERSQKIIMAMTLFLMTLSLPTNAYQYKIIYETIPD